MPCNFAEELLLKPNDADLLLLKAYIVTDMGFAGRNCETIMLEWGCYEKQKLKGEDIYILTHGRAKQNGISSDNTSKIIKGSFQVKALDDYIACFDESQRTGRFFRPLKSTSNPSRPFACKSSQPIGKNKASRFGINAAMVLGLKDAEKYTGHTWKRTATTMLADAGLSLAQIKSHTGHKSDKVVQGYMDNSKVQKLTTANALALGVGGESSSSEPSAKKARQAPQVVINIHNPTFNSGSSIFQSMDLSKITSPLPEPTENP